jgi:hypothetical protein
MLTLVCPRSICAFPYLIKERRKADSGEERVRTLTLVSLGFTRRYPMPLPKEWGPEDEGKILSI